MDKYLDGRFERVEKALANLIDSISKYHPSEKLADDLATADQELLKGLRELERHQNNHAHILKLRAETAALDAQTKDIIGALWTMRKEVKNTQTTTYPSTRPKSQFTTAELLDYARRISPHTLPPPGVTNGVDLTAAPTPAQQQDGLESQAQTPNTSFNGTSAPTPTATNGGSFVSNNNDPNHLASQATTTTTATNSNGTDLPDGFRQFINPHEGTHFIPWPQTDRIRQGALASYQMLLDRGIDPRGYDPEEEEQRRRAEEQARLDTEERARIEREENERRMREERERMARERERARQQEADRRGSAVGGGEISPGGLAQQAGGEKKSQFTFLDGLDDDDDDDDD
ncbi:vitamin-D-receptor interacting mediator subunit 4-domain-containing protein [Bombardia bombarda]|uniref:Mediator of RNA polymerase II transcription subunit 4 n=1 Tax=Bombardia bombarda TaxID=252184 RepID=A0AA39X9H3_9PEZI|nr:vitamin-D-receptor interacting mediator subunit 4-domain-containing protein [Bombardia bombarda]